MTTPQTLQIATTQLLSAHDLSMNSVRAVMRDLNINGKEISYGDIYFQSSYSEGWSLEDSIVKSGSFSLEKGVSVRTVFGEKSALSYSDDISLGALQKSASVVRQAAQSGNGTRYAHASDLNSRASLYPTTSPLDSIDSRAKKELLYRLDRAARAHDARVQKVNASLAAEWDIMLVMRPDGSVAADVRPLVRLSVTVLVEDKGRRQSGHAGGGGRWGYEFFTNDRVDSYAHEAVRVALVNLHAQPAKAGTMPIVLGAGWPGILLHEAVGHGLEGDFNRKGSSAFAHRMGKRVAAKGVTVVDDGTLANARGSLNIDDEGTPTGSCTLIEDGILTGYLQDVMNANLMKQALTGNGRRQSYAHLPMPRMTNTYMQPGTHTKEEMIASVKNGIYAVNFGGGQVDITSGKFVFTASEAYQIENGKITYPVLGVTLIGNGPESLMQVEMIGNDLAMDEGVGTCGKEGQTVPVGVGQPTLKVGGLVVGGTA